MAISTLRLRELFLDEARRRCHDLHTAAPQTPDLLTVAGCLLLSIGLACDGSDELSLQYHQYGRQTAEHLGLFNTSRGAPPSVRSPSATANDLRASAHVAWGAYAWINVFSELYHMPLISQPPAFQIPRYTCACISFVNCSKSDRDRQWWTGLHGPDIRGRVSTACHR